LKTKSSVYNLIYLQVDRTIRIQCLKQKLPGSQTSCIESIGFTKKLFINPDLYDDDMEEGAAANSSN